MRNKSILITLSITAIFVVSSLIGCKGRNSSRYGNAPYNPYAANQQLQNQQQQNTHDEIMKRMTIEDNRDGRQWQSEYQADRDDKNFEKTLYAEGIAAVGGLGERAIEWMSGGKAGGATASINPEVIGNQAETVAEGLKEGVNLTGTDFEDATPEQIAEDLSFIDTNLGSGDNPFAGCTVIKSKHKLRRLAALMKSRTRS